MSGLCESPGPNGGPCASGEECDSGVCLPCCARRRSLTERCARKIFDCESQLCGAMICESPGGDGSLLPDEPRVHVGRAAAACAPRRSPTAPRSLPEQCVSGTALSGRAAPLPNGGMCGLNQDCLSHLCQERPVRGAPARQARRAPATPSANRASVSRGPPGEPQPNGSMCGKDADCGSGNCLNGLCESGLPDGAACQQSSQCTSGRCAGGVCTSSVG